MRRVNAVLVVSLLALSGCSRAPAASAPQVQANLNQRMRGVLFPNSNIIFDAQDRDPGRAGRAVPRGVSGGTAAWLANGRFA